MIWADFYRVLEVIYITYNMGTWNLPDIHAHTLGPAALGFGYIHISNNP